MNEEVIDTRHFEEILTRKQSELVRGLRTRGEIVIERSADQMDEIQYAAERDLAIRDVDRESGQLREVKSALRRIADGTFGSCIQCEEPITRKRLAALPWAPRCIQCQESADHSREDATELSEQEVNQTV